MKAMEVSQPRPAARRKRRTVGLITIAASLALILWIVLLARTLPSSHAVLQWRSAWVGFDGLELAAGATTGWAVATERPWAALAAIATGTFLISDAWFDVALTWGSRGEATSIGLALFAELPLAVVLWAFVPRLVTEQAAPADVRQP